MIDIQEIIGKTKLLEYKEQRCMSMPVSESERQETMELAQEVKRLIEQYKIENE